MADVVNPIVRLLVPCEEVEHDPSTGFVRITNPIAVAAFTGPADVTELWMYAQLAEGVGTFRLSVDLRQVYDDGTPSRSVGRSEILHLTFPGANQLNVYDLPFRMVNVPFDFPGLYEFRVLADDAELQGQTALIRLFDPRTTP